MQKARIQNCKPKEMLMGFWQENIVCNWIKHIANVYPALSNATGNATGTLRSLNILHIIKKFCTYILRVRGFLIWFILQINNKFISFNLNNLIGQNKQLALAFVKISRHNFHNIIGILLVIHTLHTKILYEKVARYVQWTLIYWLSEGF